MSLIKLAKKITIDTSHLKEDDEELMKIKAIVNKMLKDDKLVKKAQSEHENFFTKHPMLTAGIGLTAGIAGADVAAGIYKNRVAKMPWKQALTHEMGTHAKEGLVYGAALSAIEPAVVHSISKPKKGE